MTLAAGRQRLSVAGERHRHQPGPARRTSR